MYPRSSSPAKPTTMFRPSDRNANRMARLVMRTHAVPAAASANGRPMSAMATSATPSHFACGFEKIFIQRLASCPSSPVPNALAEESGRTQYEYGDQHQEGKHVLVIATENVVGQITDIACGEGFDDAEEDAAQHRSRKVADTAQHGGRDRFQAGRRTHGEVGNTV